MTARRLLLWRHGRTAHNLKDRFQGQLDTDLDEAGLRQAELAAQALLEVIGADIPVRILSSDLRRASASARPLGELLGVPVELDPRLREIDVGRWQGLTRTEIEARWPEDFVAWRHGEDLPVGGGESRSEAGHRTTSAVAELVEEQDGGALVVVSHGGVLRAATFLMAGLSGPPDAVVPWEPLAGLHNAHWAELNRVDDSGTEAHHWRLSSYNVGALPQDGGTAPPLPIWNRAQAPR